MMIISIILGILMIVGGIFCMATPLTTYLSTGYFMSAMLLFFGIAGLIRCFMKKANALEIVVSVLAIIMGLIALFLPGTTLVFDVMMLYMTAAWFVVQGIVSIVLAFKLKGTDELWFIGLIAGILGVIVGVYSFLHPAVLAVSSGMLIGFYFIQSGIDTIVLGAVIDRNEK
ncbi:MAG: DUF308 domain-containing protein [Clostridia bacterium]|nr:DUF308 domain-containing protein [Clostridia bacterium]